MFRLAACVFLSCVAAKPALEYSQAVVLALPSELSQRAESESGRPVIIQNYVASPSGQYIYARDQNVPNLIAAASNDDVSVHTIYYSDNPGNKPEVQFLNANNKASSANNDVVVHTLTYSDSKDEAKQIGDIIGNLEDVPKPILNVPTSNNQVVPSSANNDVIVHTVTYSDSMQQQKPPNFDTNKQNSYKSHPQTSYDVPLGSVGALQPIQNEEAPFLSSPLKESKFTRNTPSANNKEAILPLLDVRFKENVPYVENKSSTPATFTERQDSRSQVYADVQGVTLDENSPSVKTFNVQVPTGSFFDPTSLLHRNSLPKIITTTNLSKQESSSFQYSQTKFF